jgi:hypothetical protein
MFFLMASSKTIIIGVIIILMAKGFFSGPLTEMYVWVGVVGFFVFFIVFFFCCWLRSPISLSCLGIYQNGNTPSGVFLNIYQHFAQLSRYITGPDFAWFTSDRARSGGLRVSVFEPLQM